eukprot:TRINITY_DN12811_c0_g2_i1.p1 TRINITY_DN12811_c0_g2~~TRINITY_DN12811_c0_g2_i1.p1  ORF type:complete len:261 (+),score=56.60 TRINITY_DN12811_c0_g2_i1:413-1195(+)
MLRVNQTIIDQQRDMIARLERQLGGGMVEDTGGLCEYGHPLAGSVDGQDCCEYGHRVQQSHRPQADRLKPVRLLSGSEAFWQLLRCPITKNALREPVVASDGHTYDKYALAAWMRSHGLVSPVSLQAISSVHFPNFALKSLLEFVPQTEYSPVDASDVLEMHTIAIILSQTAITGKLLAICSLVSSDWASAAEEEHLWVRVMSAEFDVSASCAAREGKMSYRRCYAKAAASRTVNQISSWNPTGDGAVKLHSNKPSSPKK